MVLLKKFFSKNYLAFIVFLFATLICQYTGNRGVFPIDSFSHFDSGYRILNGEHPFKDYWIVSGVFIDYFQSLIFYFFGVSWQSYLLNASLINGILSLLIYFLFNNLGLNLKLSFFYSICFAVLAYPSSGTPFVDHHSSFLSIMALIFFIWAMKTNKSYLWFFIPVFLLFAFLSKQVPATYIFFSIILVMIFHLIQQPRKKCYKIILLLSSSSLLLFIFLYLFYQFNSIDIKSFLTQYFLYPSTIGAERYEKINYDFKNTVLNFKFIHFALFFLVYFTIKNAKKKKNFYKEINFKVCMVCVFLFLSLIQHIIVTKNQIFIFFLIPLFIGFAHIQLINLNKNFKKYFSLILIIYCVGTTIKYHYRFNIDRKFHELSNVKFSEAIEPEILSKKFGGLQWITPGIINKKEAVLEIQFLKDTQDILKEDTKRKIVLTNYSFFSVLLEDNISGYSRWYPGDNSAFPTKGNYYFKNFKDFIVSTISKKKINSIYILPDIKEDNLINYIDPKCFDKQILVHKIIKYEVNKTCSNLFVWKN